MKISLEVVENGTEKEFNKGGKLRNPPRKWWYHKRTMLGLLSGRLVSTKNWTWNIQSRNQNWTIRCHAWQIKLQHRLWQLVIVRTRKSDQTCLTRPCFGMTQMQTHPWRLLQIISLPLTQQTMESQTRAQMTKIRKNRANCRDRWPRGPIWLRQVSRVAKLQPLINIRTMEGASRNREKVLGLARQSRSSLEEKIRGEILIIMVQNSLSWPHWKSVARLSKCSMRRNLWELWAKKLVRGNGNYLSASKRA